MKGSLYISIIVNKNEEFDCYNTVNYVFITVVLCPVQKVKSTYFLYLINLFGYCLVLHQIKSLVGNKLFRQRIKIIPIQNSFALVKKRINIAAFV